MSTCIKYYVISCREKLLTDWLKCIPHLPDTLRKHYLPGAFLKVVASGKEAYQKHVDFYQELIIAMDSLQKKLPSEFLYIISDFFKTQH